MVERRGRKKGPSLVYQFQRSIESGDASDEEASPCDPKSNNPMHKEQSKAISMVVDIETEDALKDVPSWLSPKIFGWHVQTYSTIKVKIFCCCYVLLWF